MSTKANLKAMYSIGDVKFVSDLGWYAQRTCNFKLESNRPIRGGHEKPSFRLGGGGRLQNAPSANAFL